MEALLVATFFDPLRDQVHRQTPFMTDLDRQVKRPGSLLKNRFQTERLPLLVIEPRPDFVATDPLDPLLTPLSEPF